MVRILLCKIADIVFEAQFKYNYCRRRMAEYLYTGSEKPAFSVSVTDSEIEHSMSVSPDDFPEPYHEWMCVYRKLCLQALNFDCLFLHCSAVCVDGKAYLFTAESGTGKSTHVALWCEHFGERAVVVNDDKPLLRYLDGNFYVYGTPWDGKHHRSSNMRAPIEGICILSRGEVNTIRKATVEEANFMLLNQTVRPGDTGQMVKTLELADTLLRSVPFYKLECNISDEAVTVAYEGMSNDEN